MPRRILPKLILLFGAICILVAILSAVGAVISSQTTSNILTNGNRTQARIESKLPLAQTDGPRLDLKLIPGTKTQPVRLLESFSVSRKLYDKVESGQRLEVGWEGDWTTAAPIVVQDVETHTKRQYGLLYGALGFLCFGLVMIMIPVTLRKRWA